ncbi:MAG: phosphoribosylamine--glycine ligase [Oscillospiraceae bacterium]|nr:phosphoribosylamine--glycine ligase [Oscillospiraceae bacterium]
MSLFNLAVLVSGFGSNLQALINATERGDIPQAKLALVVSDRGGAYALTRAKEHGIESVFIDKKDTAGLLSAFNKHDIHAIILAGYLSILPREIVDAYKNKIINIHPALLPSFGGMGYYGIKVHEAVLSAGVSHTGATAHIVDSGVDTGAILAQGTVPVFFDDTPRSLQKRVLKTEHKVLVYAVRALTEGKIGELIRSPAILKQKRVLIIGSGGREHAIGWKLAQNAEAELYFAPGNAGTAQIGENIEIDASDTEKLAGFAEAHDIYLTVVGPEIPLTLGIADVFRERGLCIFGPGKTGAKLEGSKSFAKRFMRKYNIPTANCSEVTDFEDGLRILKNSGYPIVLKADGTAAGKGVLICQNEKEAQSVLKDMLVNNVFDRAGSRVVIEEFLTGKEVSLLCFTDSDTIIPMETASDYKRALDNDMGLNTGGMGSISPSPYYTPELTESISDIAKKTLLGLKSEGFDYRGVIYIGLLLTSNGPMVLEYNARFGDPETQALMPRLESDLLDVLKAVSDKRLAETRLLWKKEKAVCVVMASRGYPAKYDTGFEISIPGDIKSEVFHAGTRIKDGKTVTDGGRVLALTALGGDFKEARNAVYRDVEKIRFAGAVYRTDIGLAQNGY